MIVSSCVREWDTRQLEAEFLRYKKTEPDRQGVAEKARGISIGSIASYCRTIGTLSEPRHSTEIFKEHYRSAGGDFLHLKVTLMEVETRLVKNVQEIQKRNTYQHLRPTP